MAEKSLLHRLAAFFDTAAESWAEGRDFDGGDIQDEGVRLGLLVETTFNSEIHEDSECLGVTDGDPWFVIAPDVLSVIREAQK